MTRSTVALISTVILSLCVHTPAFGQWKYRSELDPMTDGKEYYATVRSINKHQFAFPYQGGTWATITVREHPTMGRDVYMTIDRGQFTCNDDCTALVRFDDEHYFTFLLSRPSDGSSDVIFLRNDEAFITSASTAQRIRVSATFHQHGVLIYEFRAGPLTWPPASTPVQRRRK